LLRERKLALLKILALLEIDLNVKLSHLLTLILLIFYLLTIHALLAVRHKLLTYLFVRGLFDSFVLKL